MAHSDEEDDPIPPGRLIEDEQESENLFGGNGRGGRSSRIVVFQDEWRRTYHAELTNTLRGDVGNSSTAAQHSVGDYILREGRYSIKAEEVLAKGGDPDHVDACVRHVSEQARSSNSAVAIRITVELPNELPLAGKIAIAELQAKRLADSGRPALWAIHPAARRKKFKSVQKQDHLHLIAPARPVVLLYGVQVVLRGKYLSDRAAIRVWREGIAAEANRQMAKHALRHSVAPRWSPGTLREMGVDRPTKMRLSARAALREEPDLTHPADQLPLAWNAAIDQGEDPMEDSIVKELLEHRARHRILSQLLRDIAEMQTGNGPGKGSSRAMSRPHVKPVAASADLPPLSAAEIADTQLAYWRFGRPLPASWPETQEARAAATEVRELYLQRFAQMFSNIGYPPPPTLDPKTAAKIYLAVSAERRREALRMGANSDPKGFFVWGDAPEAVVNRILMAFHKQEGTPAAVPDHADRRNSEARAPSINADLQRMLDNWLASATRSAAPQAKQQQPQNKPASESSTTAVARSTLAALPDKPARTPEIRPVDGSGGEEPAATHQSKPDDKAVLAPQLKRQIQPGGLASPSSAAQPRKPASPITPQEPASAPDVSPLEVSPEERSAATEGVSKLSDAVLLATFTRTLSSYNRLQAQDRVRQLTVRQYCQKGHLNLGLMLLRQEIQKRHLPLPSTGKPRQSPQQER